MSLRAALFAGVGALLLILALGNPAVSDALDEDETYGVWAQVVSGATWDTDTYGSEQGFGTFGEGEDGYRTGLVLRAVVFVLLCGLLGGIAGRARFGAAFIGGWGITFLASAIGTTVFIEVATPQSLSLGGNEDPTVMDTLVSTSIFWAGLPLLFGWVVGLATMFGATLPQAPRRLATDLPPAPPPPYSPGAYAAGAGTAYGPPPVGGAPSVPGGVAAGPAPAISAPPERTARHDAVAPPAPDDGAPPSPS